MNTATYLDLLESLERYLQDTASRIIPERKPRIIDDALLSISRWAPLEKAKEVVGNNTQEYDLPSDFLEWSQIKKIYFPFITLSTSFPIQVDPGTDFMLLRRESGLKLRFLTNTPQASQKFLLIYTTKHEAAPGEDNMGSGTSTMPEELLELFGLKAGEIGHRILAAFFAQTVDPTLDGDTTDYQGRSDKHKELAESLRIDFEKEVNRAFRSPIRGQMPYLPGWGGVPLTRGVQGVGAWPLR